ncbi:unnamed protein product [Gemmata massiliana]|uniref:Rho termination factor N-terminal domain-containing protein n=1 Tax=Gemmata massiliana TaxID=1210884 RepID=A0A6P2D558_9BACT|nr:hypothetical protein [Gemmata massiliana]VTR96037.1 unnamed protein product [Gemmata massiliana]
MNPTHKRIAEMAAGWEGSKAEITLSPRDAQLLTERGAKVKPGRREFDPATIAAPDLCAAVEEMLLDSIRDELGIEKEAPKVEPVGDDGLDKKTVAELRALAAAESVAVSADVKKADVIEAIRKARAPK